jgi:hypothetical protein
MKIKDFIRFMLFSENIKIMDNDHCTLFEGIVSDFIPLLEKYECYEIDVFYCVNNVIYITIM